MVLFSAMFYNVFITILERMFVMMKKHKSLNVRFLVIALSLAVVTTVLGLSAYITETSTYNAPFRVATGSDLGFSISGVQFDEENLKLVTPGDEITISATASVSGATPLYVFIEMNTPADCKLIDFCDFDWHPIANNSKVYYYGTNGKLSALGGTNSKVAAILSGISVNQSASTGQSFDFSITGYAIQEKNLEDKANSPAEVYNLIVRQNNP